MSHPKNTFLQGCKEDLERLAHLEFDVSEDFELLPRDYIEIIKELISKQWDDLTEEDHKHVEKLGITEEAWPSDLDKLQEILDAIYDYIPVIEKIVLPLNYVTTYIAQRIALDDNVELSSSIKHFDSDQIFDTIVEYYNRFSDYYLLSKIQCPSGEIRLALKQALKNNDQVEFCRIFDNNGCDSHDFDVFLSSDISAKLSAANIVNARALYSPLANNVKKLSFFNLINEGDWERCRDIMNLIEPAFPAAEKKIFDFVVGCKEDAKKWYPKYVEIESRNNDSKFVSILCYHIDFYLSLYLIDCADGDATSWQAIKEWKMENKLLPFEINVINDILNRPGGKELVEEWEKAAKDDEQDELAEEKINDKKDDSEEPYGITEEEKVKGFYIKEKETALDEEQMNAPENKETPEQILESFFGEWPLEDINKLKIEDNFNAFYLDVRLWLNKQIPWKTYKYSDRKFKKEFLDKPEPLTDVFIKNFSEIYEFLASKLTEKPSSIENSLLNCKLLFYRLSGMDCGLPKGPVQMITWHGSHPEYRCFIKNVINSGLNYKLGKKYFEMEGHLPAPGGDTSGQANVGSYYDSIHGLLTMLDVIGHSEYKTRRERG